MVKVHSVLNADYIQFIEVEQKSDALNQLVEGVAQSPNISDKEKFRDAVFKREALMSTGIGLGLAIPHVKIPEVRDLTIGIGISRKGIEWESLDGKPVHIIFLIAGSDHQHDQYLRTLSKLVLVLKNQKRRRDIIHAHDADSVIRLFENI